MFEWVLERCILGVLMLLIYTSPFSFLVSVGNVCKNRGNY